MNIKEILSLLQVLQKKNNISTTYIVGGIPRDKILNILSDTITDIDLTNGDQTIKNLGKEFFMFLNKGFNIKSSSALDGHETVYVGDLKVDFSSNFKSPHIDEELKKLGIKNPTDLQKETFSRDFTCNTLLMDLDLKHIKDITDQGLKDIRNRILKTCLPPEITFNDNVRRIIRVIYIAAKLNFTVDPIIIEWIKNNKNLIVQSGNEYLSKKIDASLDYNSKITVDLINELNLWNYLPITKKLQPFYKESIAKHAQLFHNYDLGTGFYSNLDKVKSVSDFQKNKRKKRKKLVDQIIKIK